MGKSSGQRAADLIRFGTFCQGGRWMEPNETPTQGD
jgi:hypothetical protein